MVFPSPSSAHIVTKIDGFQRWAIREMLGITDTYKFTTVLSRAPYALNGRTYRLYPEMGELMQQIDQLLSPWHATTTSLHTSPLSVPSSSSSSSTLSAPSTLKVPSEMTDASSSAHIDALATIHQRLNTLIAYMTRALVDDAFEYQGTSDRATEKAFFKKVLTYACHVRYTDLSSSLVTFFQRISEGANFKPSEQQYRTLLNSAVSSKNADSIMALFILVPESKVHPLDNPLFLTLMSGDESLFRGIWERCISQNSRSKHSPFSHLMRLLQNITQPAQAFYSTASSSSSSPTEQQLLQPLSIAPEKKSAVDAGLCHILTNITLSVMERYSLLKISFNNYSNPGNILNYLFNQNCHRSFEFLLKTSILLSVREMPHRQEKRQHLLLLLATDPNNIQLLDQLCRYLYVHRYHPSSNWDESLEAREIGFSSLFKVLATYACERQRLDLWNMLLGPSAHSYKMLKNIQERNNADWMSLQTAGLTFPQYLIDVVNDTQTLWAIEQLLAHDTLRTLLISQSENIKKLAYHAASLGNSEIARRLMVLSIDSAESVIEGALYAFNHTSATTAEEFQSKQEASITLMRETLEHYKEQYRDAHLEKLIIMLIAPDNAIKKTTGAEFNILEILLGATTETWQLIAPASLQNPYVQYLQQLGRYQAPPIITPLTFDAFLPQLPIKLDAEPNAITSNANTPTTHFIMPESTSDTTYITFSNPPAHQTTLTMYPYVEELNPDTSIQDQNAITAPTDVSVVSVSPTSVTTMPTSPILDILALTPLTLEQANADKNVRSTKTTPEATSLGHSSMSIFSGSAAPTAPITPTIPVVTEQDSSQRPPAATPAPQAEAITPFIPKEVTKITALRNAPSAPCTPLSSAAPVSVSKTMQALQASKPVVDDTPGKLEPPIYN